MELPNNLIEFIKQEAKRIHHGEITIVLNESANVYNKIDVITKSRERFEKRKKSKEN